MRESGFAPCVDSAIWSKTRMQSSLRTHLTYWLIGPLLLLVVAGNLVFFCNPPDAAPHAPRTPPPRSPSPPPRHPPRTPWPRRVSLTSSPHSRLRPRYPR